MANVYKIAVSLALTSNAPGVLATLSKQFLGLNQSVGTLEKAFGRLGPVMTAGLAGVAASGFIAGLKTATDYGKVLIDQQDKLIRAGLTHAQVAGLTADAYQRIAQAVPTATGADILQSIGELRTVTGSLDRAVAAAPLALQAQSLLENVTGQDAEGAGFALWRSIEMKGLTAGNAAMQRLGQQLIETFIQNIAGAGGKLTANDYQLLAKRGGAYWAHANPEFLAGPMSVVAADMGGDAAGTTLATFGQFLTGATTLSRQQYQALDRLHLVNRRLVSTDRGGRINMQPGAIVGSTQYSGDYFDWVQKELFPALKAAGVKPGPEEDSILAKIGRNRNATRMLSMFSDPGFVAQIEKDIAIWRQGMTPGAAYGDFVHNNPKGVDAAFNKQYQSMMQAIGAPLEQAAIPVMSAITSMFTKIGALAQAHPNIVKELGFDAVFGPLAYFGDVLKTLGGALAPVPQEAQAFASAIGKAAGVLEPAAHAADALANAIGKLGADIEGAIKALGGSWAIPSTGYLGKNPIHKGSFDGPASSAHAIHAALVSPERLAIAGVPILNEAQAASVKHMQLAMNNAVTRTNDKGELVIHNHVHLDGKQVGKSVTKYQTRMAEMPLGVHGGPDSHGSFVGPGTTFQNS